MYQRIAAWVSAATFVLLGLGGCASLGPIVPGDALSEDARSLPSGDLAGIGPQAVTASRVSVEYSGESMEVGFYQPSGGRATEAAIVFLPGLMAPEDQYDSYARALASRGFTVVVHDWYSPFTSDQELARDAELLADWLVTARGADRRHIGIAGHSMGAKDAILAAATDSGRFAGVVAIDPDDAGEFSVARGPLAELRAPLLLIGAEMAWRASDICAPKKSNYERFFERAPPGTVELTLRDADHVQMLDEPDRLGYGICRCGTADSRQVRITARRATVGFFVQHLQDGPAAPEPPATQAIIRVAQGAHLAEKQAHPWLASVSGLRAAVAGKD